MPASQTPSVHTPDFWGSWLTEKEAFAQLTEYGQFFVYIHEREALTLRKERIGGTIEDVYGSATFEGELTPEYITFTKRYGEEAKARAGGMTTERIDYRGSMGENETYRGTFSVKNRAGSEHKDWEGPFFMTNRPRVNPTSN